MADCLCTCLSSQFIYGFCCSVFLLLPTHQLSILFITYSVCNCLICLSFFKFPRCFRWQTDTERGRQVWQRQEETAEMTWYMKGRCFIQRVAQVAWQLMVSQVTIHIEGLYSTVLVLDLVFPLDLSVCVFLQYFTHKSTPLFLWACLWLNVCVCVCVNIKVCLFKDFVTANTFF